MDTLIRLLAEGAQLGWAVAVAMVIVVIGLVKRVVSLSKESIAASDRNTETVRTIADKNTETLVLLMRERHEREIAHTKELSEIHGRIHTLVQVLDERLPRKSP